MAKQNASFKGYRVWDALIRFTAAWLGAWIPLWILLGPCGVDFPILLPIVLAGYTVILKMTGHCKKRLWRVLPRVVLVLVSVLAVGLLFEKTVAGYYNCYDVVADALNKYYALGLELFGEGAAEPVELVLVLLLPSLILLLLSDMASEGRFWIPWLLVSCIFPWMGVLVDVFCPVWLACMYIGLVLFFLMTHGSHGLRTKVGARCRAFTVAGLTLMMLAACLIISGDRYEDSIRDWKGRTAVGDFLTAKFPVLFGRNQTGEAGGEPFNTSGISGGVLPSAGHLEYSGEVVGTVTLPKDFGDLYLRTGAYGTYTGTAWVSSPVSLVADFPVMLEHNCVEYDGEGSDDLLFELRRAKISVELTRESKYLPLPYWSLAPLSNLVSLTQEGVAQLTRSIAASYTVDCYYNPLHLPGIAAYSDDVRDPAQALKGGYNEVDPSIYIYGSNPYYESSSGLASRKIPEWYRAEVYDNYMSIPLDKREKLRELVPYKENESIFDSILRVQKFLSANYAYTTRPGKVPEGEDFIEYFLFKNKKGYCAYYASAAVMMFRWLGIPARYVEGYYLEDGIVKSSKKAASQSVVVHTKDGRIVNTNTEYVEVEISDQYAHAWVEVFIDDYGWYPVEVTHSYASKDLESALAAAKKQEKLTPTPTPEITPSEPKNTPTPKPKTSTTVTPKPTPKGQNTDPKGPSEAKQNAQDHLRMLVKVLAIIGLFAIPFLIVGARWTRRQRIRRRKTNQRNVNAAFVEVCRDIGRVIRLRGLAYSLSETDSAYIEKAGAEYGHEEDFEWLYETGNRAAYSGEQIEIAERKRAIAFYRTLRKETLSELSWPKRLIMKYLYVL